jgi:hypothetical protein
MGARDSHLELEPGIATRIWCSHATMQQLSNIDFAWTGDTFHEGDAPCVRLPMFLILPEPLEIPTGMIGPASMGAAGVTAVFCCLMQSATTPTWLKRPVMTKWFNAVATAPTKFATDWISRSWIAESVSVSVATTTPEWQSNADYNIMAHTERTLAWHLHYDCMLAWSTTSKWVRQSLVKALELGYQGLYNPNTDLGTRPLAIAGKLVYLRPPGAAAWANQMG